MGMGDSLTIVVIIILAALLMYMFPLMSTSDMHDEVAQMTVSTAVSEFVNTAVNTGKITEDNYSRLISKLYATGNTYDVNMEIQVLDENPKKKNNVAAAGVGDKLGENTTYSLYTTQILEDLEANNGVKYLKQGDTLTVTASNSNNTIAQMLKNFFYSLSGNNIYSIVASESGRVAVTGMH